jgi:bifunctional non-homologous end joining protein LigD
MEIRTSGARPSGRDGDLLGEAIVAGEDGLSDFFALHAALARKNAPLAVLVAFDLMHLDGEDLRGRALEDRRAILADVVSKRAPWLPFSESIAGDGPQVWRHACNMGPEGIVSKRRGSPYISGKSPVWRKTKCTLTDHFPVMGADPTGRSLRLSRFLGRGLVPCGSGRLPAEPRGRSPNPRHPRRWTCRYRLRLTESFAIP